MRVLIVSQVIPQWYVDVLTNAFPKNTEIKIITGSDVKADVISCPKHDPRSFASRLKCWFQHLRFMHKWIQKNKKEHFDLIFAVSNPPVNSYVGLKLKKVFKCPFIFMNWDIYPQFIDYSIQNPLVHMVCNLWNGWNNRNYKKIDKMLTIGNVVAKSINLSLKQKIDIDVIPIGVNCSYLKPVPKADNRFLKENGIEDKFIVLYSGKMGFGHNLELVLDTAKMMREYESVLFLFIGEGQKFDMVKAEADKPESTNIRVFPFQPDDIFPMSMACGDIGVVAEEQKMAHLFMPSKTYSMMACGMPVIGICSDNDDLSNLIKDTGVGVSVSDGDAAEMKAYILDMYQNAEKLTEQKEKARKIAVEQYELKNITRQYKELFEKYI